MPDQGGSPVASRVAAAGAGLAVPMPNVDRAWPLGAVLAVAFPTLIAYNVPPSATFFNQVAAVFGWGVWMLLLAPGLGSPSWRTDRHRLRPGDPLLALLVALAVLAAAALAAPLWAGQPFALALSSALMIGASALVAGCGAALASRGWATAAFRALCLGLLAAALAGSAIAVLQAFAPWLADGNWIAHARSDGRAAGNLRQPNHLSSLLLWGLVALAWLQQPPRAARALPGPVALLLALSMLSAIVLSASRSGVVGVAMLAVWGALDRRLSRGLRVALLLAPVAYGLLWQAASLWAALNAQVFVGEARLGGGGDISGSRFAIWRNTLALIAAQPWLGVGFGEYNFAWTLTPFPDRPREFFDHAHNLPLHLAAELGVPLAAVVLLSLGVALWRAWQAGHGEGAADLAETTTARAAFVMVAMILVHSLFEYPLWYAYFLLPTMFALGLGIGLWRARPAPGKSASHPLAVAATPRATPRPAGRGLRVAAGGLMVGALLAVQDYMRVVVIFAPGTRAAPLAQRIADGQGSWLFSHHADYAAVTTETDPALAAAGWRGAPHYLLDARLMMAWANAFEAAGDADRARHVAQRLREFHNPQAAEFFAACREGEARLGAASKPSAAGGLPYPCLPPRKVLGYRDFRGAGAGP